VATTTSITSTTITITRTVTNVAAVIIRTVGSTASPAVQRAYRLDRARLVDQVLFRLVVLGRTARTSQVRLLATAAADGHGKVVVVRVVVDVECAQGDFENG